MNNKFLFLFYGLIISLSVIAQNNAIRVGNDGKSWNIVTRSSGYHIEVSTNGAVNST